MATMSYFLFLSLIAVVILTSLITVSEGEGPFAKRRRLSIARLRSTGRLRRIYKKRGYEDPMEGFEPAATRYAPESEELSFRAEDILDLLDELEALQRLRGSSTEYEKRGKKQYNAWNTGMFGKRSPSAEEVVRESRNMAQIYQPTNDYFGKRYNGDASGGLPAAPDWKRAFNLQDVADEDME